MDPRELQIEDEKYSFLWANGYKPARWKLLARQLLKRAREVSENPTVIDFGSGQGNAIEYFSKKGLRSAGVDISRFAVERLRKKGFACFWASLDSLSEIPDSSFEFGFSNDVLEHIPEPYIDAAFSEMKRVCTRTLFVSICPVLSRNKSRDGDNLHLTVRPKKWWEEKLIKIGTVREIRFFLNRSIRYEISIHK